MNRPWLERAACRKRQEVSGMLITHWNVASRALPAFALKSNYLDHWPNDGIVKMQVKSGEVYELLVQVARLLCSLATCSLMMPPLAAAPHTCFSVGYLYQQNCTVELLIRIPPLSYALMGGAISPLILWLVRFKLVSKELDWNSGMG